MTFQYAIFKVMKDVDFTDISFRIKNRYFVRAVYDEQPSHMNYLSNETNIITLALKIVLQFDLEINIGLMGLPDYDPIPMMAAATFNPAD